MPARSAPEEHAIGLRKYENMSFKVNGRQVRLTVVQETVRRSRSKEIWHGSYTSTLSVENM